MKKAPTLKKNSLKFRKNLITGIITALPLFITYIFFSWLMKFFHKKLNFIPQKLFPENLFLIVSFEIILFILIIIGLYIIGVLANLYFGRKLIKIGDTILNKIPLVRNIYMGSKQILSSFAVSNKKAFRKVVLLEYPRKGINSIGFLTGYIKISKSHNKKETMVSVFLPSTPNPTTGFLLLLPEKDIKVINISVEDAVKLIISGGVLGNQLKIDDK